MPTPNAQHFQETTDLYEANDVSVKIFSLSFNKQTGKTLGPNE